MDGAEPIGQGSARQAQLGIEHRRFDGGLGHRMPPHGRQQTRNRVRGDLDGAHGPWAAESTRSTKSTKEMAANEHVGAVDVLGGVERLVHGDALAPPLGVGPHDPDEQHVASRLDAERGAEGRHQREAGASQLDVGDLHGDPPLVDPSNT